MTNDLKAQLIARTYNRLREINPSAPTATHTTAAKALVDADAFYLDYLGRLQARRPEALAAAGFPDLATPTRSEQIEDVKRFEAAIGGYVYSPPTKAEPVRTEAGQAFFDRYGKELDQCL